MRKLGLSLLEVLLVIAIMGILLAAITKVVTGTLATTSLATSQSDQLLSIKDTVGYVSDQIRSAAAVYDTLTVDSNVCSTNNTTAPCFGVKQPVVDSSGNITVDSYVIKVFRLRTRSNLDANYKIANSWADSNTYFLEEYRYSCTTSGCPNNAGSISGGSWYFVADDLTLNNTSGTFTPFTVVTNGSSIRDGVIIRVRATAQISGRQIYVPSNGIYSVTVRARNI